MAAEPARSETTDLPLAEHPVLWRMGRLRRVEAGTVLLAASCEVTEVFVVRGGILQLEVRHETGGRQPVEVISRGGIVGDEAVLAGGCTTVDIVAETAAAVLAIPASTLMRALNESPGLAQRWLASLAARSEHTRQRMRCLQTHGLTGRVAAVLVDHCIRQSNGTWAVELSHTTIAGLVGARRQSVSRVFAELRDAGLVSNGYRRVVVHDQPGLEALTP